MERLGFGLMRLPLQNENDPASVDVQQVKDMVDLYIKRGFNYFDTAYGYHKGISESILKEAVVDRYPREEIVITDKLPLFSLSKTEQMEEIFNQQLTRCGVDYFDYYLLHAVRSGLKDRFEDIDSFGFIKDKKEEGLIKHIGISFHDNAEYLDYILDTHPEVEVVQLQINYIDWDSDIIESRKCYEVAKKHNKPVIVMEPIKGGSLINISENAKKILTDYNPNLSIASWALRFCLSLDNVMMVLSGMNSFDQMDDNTKIVDKFEPLNDMEYVLLDKVRDILNDSIKIKCTGCNYCVGTCPKNIPIPKYFNMYNTDNLLKSNMKLYYKIFSREKGLGKLTDCIECGTCLKRCPQHLKIPDLLKVIAEEFE